MNHTHITLTAAVAAERLADVHRAADHHRTARLATAKPRRPSSHRGGRRRAPWARAADRAVQQTEEPYRSTATGHPAGDHRPNLIRKEAPK